MKTYKIKISTKKTKQTNLKNKENAEWLVFTDKFSLKGWKTNSTAAYKLRETMQLFHLYFKMIYKCALTKTKVYIPLTLIYKNRAK